MPRPKTPANEEGFDEEDSLFNALNHSIRRTIIKLIGGSGFSSFTAFRNATGVSTGTIYHHLEVLKPLVTQNSSKKYVLTAQGEQAYRILSNDQSPTPGPQESRMSQMTRGVTRRLLYLDDLFSAVGEKPRVAWGLLIGVLLSGVLLCAYTRLTPILFNFTVGDWLPWLPGGAFIVNFLGVALVLWLLAGKLVGKLLTLVSVLHHTALLFLPMLGYLVIVTLVPSASFSYEISSKIVLILAQVWSIFLLSNALYVLGKYRPDKAFAVAIVWTYVSWMLLIISRNPAL